MLHDLCGADMWIIIALSSICRKFDRVQSDRNCHCRWNGKWEHAESSDDERQHCYLSPSPNQGWCLRSFKYAWPEQHDAAYYGGYCIVAWLVMWTEISLDRWLTRFFIATKRYVRLTYTGIQSFQTWNWSRRWCWWRSWRRYWKTIANNSDPVQ